MKRFRSPAIVLGLCVCIGGTLQSVSAETPPAAGASMPKSDAKVAVAAGVDAASVAALRKMSAYLMSLKSAAITSRGSLDAVTDNGQRIQLDGVTTYKMRKPGFVIDYDSDIKKRRFFYDGKQFTVYSPATGHYATVAAPPTDREVLDVIYKKYGIALPLRGPVSLE